MEIDELVGIRNGKKMQEHGIHDAEDGRVGSDSQGNGEDGNGCENGRLRQLAKGVSKTLDNSHDGSTPALRISYKSKQSRPGTKIPGEERYRLQEVTCLSQD